MRHSILRGLLAALALLAAGPLAAQSIRGHVLDAGTGQPVAEATVALVSAEGRVLERERTDAAGAFSLAVREPGTYRVRAERIGYRAVATLPLEAGMRDVVDVELRMSTAEVVIDPLTVTARRQPPRLAALDAAGFYQRERSGLGRFLRREDIDRTRPREMSDVLRRLPGVRMIPVGRFGQFHVAMSRAASASAQTGVCLPRLYLDGNPIQLGAGETLDDLAQPEEIEAVEIYNGPAATPGVYGGAQSACGVIAMWTRRGEEAAARSDDASASRRP